VQIVVELPEKKAKHCKNFFRKIYLSNLLCCIPEYVAGEIKVTKYFAITASSSF